MAEHKSVIIKIKRQNNPTSKSYWEEFELAWHPGMNVISSLMEIAANPVTRDGKATTPITYDSNCLEEVCGSCAMLINGRARMACSALIDNLEQPVKLEPFSKFPIVRDLATDRSVLFENLKAVKAWVPIDGTYDLGSGPRIIRRSRNRLIRFRAAYRAPAAWRRARSSTKRRDSWARLRSPRCGCLTSSHGQGAAARAAGGADGRWRHSGMRLRAELRGGLSEGYSSDQSDLQRWVEK